MCIQMAKTTHTPTKEQSKWIKENYLKVRNIDIANRYGITQKKASDWLSFLGLRKEKRVYAGRKDYGKYKRQFKNQPIKFLSSEYSNVTRDQHVDRILAIKL
jgi:hypothetical protein